VDLVTSKRDYITLGTNLTMATRINKSLIKAFGIALRTFRMDKQLTQEELAHSSQVHRTYISFLETGRKQPSLNAVFKIAKGLDIKPSEFIERIDYHYTKKPRPRKLKNNIKPK